MKFSHNKKIEEFYNLLTKLKFRLGDYRKLGDCTGNMSWPDKGVYFFFNLNEKRRGDEQLRVVRVGTHALVQGKKTTLWSRLYQHRGTLSGGGNHRGSVFRKHVGEALMIRDNWPSFIREKWGVGSSANKELREIEYPYEKKVSCYLGNLFVLWLPVEGLDSYKMRSYLERNSIALLVHSTDVPSENWLGNYSPNELIRKSGLWNVNHVHESIDIDFLDVLSDFVGSS